MAARPTEPPPPPTPPSTAPHQMWGGRFSVGPNEALDALNRSLPVDHRLWPQDVTASKAWVHALGRVGVVTPGEETQLLEGLDRVAERLADGAAVDARGDRPGGRRHRRARSRARRPGAGRRGRSPSRLHARPARAAGAVGV